MRFISILCGLAFATIAGVFLTHAMVLVPGMPVPQTLARIMTPLTWAAFALALVGAGLALRSRCEGWTTLLAGCTLFLLSSGVLQYLTGPLGTAMLCLAAAVLALSPLARMPISYWRVAG